MTSAVRLLAASLSTVALLIVGCGDDAGESLFTPTPRPEITVTSVPSPPATTPTVAPTPSPIATPSPSPVAEPPDAAPIELDPGVESLGENVLLPTLEPAGLLNLDPVQLAEDSGITPPACAGLVFYVSWQVRHPYPPTAIDIEFYWTRMGGTELIGEGPSGQASRGCGEIQVVNNSDVEVTVQIRYAIGQLTG